MKIFLIRHGQTTSDLEDRYGGHYDDHLTEQGVEQAKALAVKLRDKGIRRIFASSLIRAQETAKILQEATGCDIETMDDLRERNFYGVLTGMQKSEAKKLYPELVERLRDYHGAIENAETYADFLRRLTAVLNQITLSNYDTVAIVSHGGPIKRLFCDIFKFGELEDLADCAVIELEKDKTDFKVVSMDGARFISPV